MDNLGKQRLDSLSFGRICIFETRYGGSGDTKYTVAWLDTAEAACKFDDHHTGGDSQWELTDALVSSNWFPAVEAPDIETGLELLRMKLTSIPNQHWDRLPEAVNVAIHSGLYCRNFNKVLKEYFGDGPASDYYVVKQW